MVHQSYLAKLFPAIAPLLLLVHSLPLVNADDCGICRPGPDDAPGVPAEASVYICKYPLVFFALRLRHYVIERCG